MTLLRTDNLESVASSAGSVIKAEQAFLRLHKFLVREQYKGYEFDDFLSSPLAKVVTGNRLLAQRIFIQVGELSPINVRPLLGIRKLESTKARGYFAKGYLYYYQANQDTPWLSHAIECLEWLLENSNRGYDGLCWGNAFDFASRGGFFPRGLPTIVWTSHIGEAFDMAFKITGRIAFQEAVKSCAQFVLKSLQRHEDRNGICFGYAPGDVSLIHNSNLLGAATIMRYCQYWKDDEARALAQESYRWSISHMNADGSWFYGIDERWHWIDNFHTAYNIDCLIAGHRIGGEETVRRADIDRAVAYWMSKLFLLDGTPKYYCNRTYPLDIQCAAQAIETLSKLRNYYPEATELAQSVVSWTLLNMQKKNGAFRYQKRRFWLNNLESIHWGQATMLAALGAYVHHCKTASSF